MEFPNATTKGRVFMTCTTETEYTWENISSQHVLAHIVSGALGLTFGKITHSFVAGDTMLILRNQLSRSVKLPLPDEPFKCISIVMCEEQLRRFYVNRSGLENSVDIDSPHRSVNSHPLADVFFSSLVSYLDMRSELPDDLVSIKIQEALTIIDRIDKKTSSILATFQSPGKIDLARYMEEHFMYNLPLEKFAFLTGRSLSAFKQEFWRIYKTTPGKWLTEKRLHLAHHKLIVEHLKPTEVYLSAGFENLSHFSFAFKKQFGFSPGHHLQLP